MGRPRLHDDDVVLDAARELLLGSGAGAASIDAIARASGAPSGSLYHRFGARNGLLGALWLRTVKRAQASFSAALAAEDPTEAAVAGALSTLDFARTNVDDARLLVSLRLRDLLADAESSRSAKRGAGREKSGGVGGGAPDRETSTEFQRRVDEANAPVARAIRELTARLEDRPKASTHGLAVVMLAIVDLPLGAIRRHLVSGRAPPSGLRDPLERAVRAALASIRPIKER